MADFHSRTRTLKRAAVLAAGLFAFVPVLSAHAATCTPEQFGAAIDQSGAQLRAFNANEQPLLNERMRALQKKKDWSDEGYQEKAYEFLQDERMAAFDTRSNELLSKIDSLGKAGEKGQGDCAALDELKATGTELLGVMKAKSAYMIERIDGEVGVAVSAAPPPQPSPSAPVSEPKPQAKLDPKPAPVPSLPAEDKQAWTAKTTPSPKPVEPAPAPQVSDAYVPPPPPPITADNFTTGEEGYSIEEIRDATRGFFGTVSTNLASVIEHTFSVAGRPTAYVLGQEGGGAFLAGLRYGDGTLYMRKGGTERVYWHGPSLGADLGASGSRTLFLIYRLKEPDDLYRSFTGVDGSAYLVGGVGVTLMKGGKVIMAPIRSGLGLRIGANVGYLRFTSRPTWNPF